MKFHLRPVGFQGTKNWRDHSLVQAANSLNRQRRKFALYIWCWHWSQLHNVLMQIQTLLFSSSLNRVSAHAKSLHTIPSFSVLCFSISGLNGRRLARSSVLKRSTFTVRIYMPGSHLIHEANTMWLRNCK